MSDSAANDQSSVVVKEEDQVQQQQPAKKEKKQRAATGSSGTKRAREDTDTVSAPTKASAAAGGEEVTEKLEESNSGEAPVAELPFGEYAENDTRNGACWDNMFWKQIDENCCGVANRIIRSPDPAFKNYRLKIMDYKIAGQQLEKTEDGEKWQNVVFFQSECVPEMTSKTQLRERVKFPFVARDFADVLPMEVNGAQAPGFKMPAEKFAVKFKKGHAMSPAQVYKITAPASTKANNDPKKPGNTFSKRR